MTIVPGKISRPFGLMIPTKKVETHVDASLPMLSPSCSSRSC